MGDDNWVKRYINVTVDGRALRGRPKIWRGILHNYLRVKELNREAASNRIAWRVAIK